LPFQPSFAQFGSKRAKNGSAKKEKYLLEFVLKFYFETIKGRHYKVVKITAPYSTVQAV
jgi:hypothetical protein